MRIGKERKHKFMTEWREGLWLGHVKSSNGHAIGANSGTVRAYAIKSMDPENQWDVDLIKGMQGTPRQPDPSRGQARIPIRITFDPPSSQTPASFEPSRKEQVRRRMLITPETLTRYGYTGECPG